MPALIIQIIYLFIYLFISEIYIYIYFSKVLMKQLPLKTGKHAVHFGNIRLTILKVDVTSLQNLFYLQ